VIFKTAAFNRSNLRSAQAARTVSVLKMVGPGRQGDRAGAVAIRFRITHLAAGAGGTDRHPKFAEKRYRIARRGLLRHVATLRGRLPSGFRSAQLCLLRQRRSNRSPRSACKDSNVHRATSMKPLGPSVIVLPSSNQSRIASSSIPFRSTTTWKPASRRTSMPRLISVMRANVVLYIEATDFDHLSLQRPDI
jgi:hypothetical protein